ncbi:MAG: Crp/Fnr family transcriptional regulator [Niastella sp.]|uniref:Crp/Fnr family transcriptional regulator n=1 Tax=Niastella sp. TaxID=1869183 RepID=UPI00389A5E35
MADLNQYFMEFSPLEEEVLAILLQSTITRTFDKGDYLLQAGNTCKYLYFINEGLAKSFFSREDKEFIMRFFSEGRVFSIFDSFLNRQPSRYALVALEQTTVTLIHVDTMEDLCKRYHSMETFFRKLVSVATTRMMRRISEMLEDNATERYNQFIAENNQILQRISLGDLAKYLGITQQSLSRIRTTR